MIAMLVEASIRAAAVAGLTGVVLAALRVRDSGVRHATWTAVLASMLLMPVLPSWVPAIRVAMPVMAPPLAPAGSTADDSGGAGDAPRLRAPVTAAAGRSSMELRGTVAPAPTSRAWSWSAVAAGVWAAVAAILLVRLVAGWRVAARLVARSRPIAAARLAVPPALTVHESEHVITPVTTGVFAPRIILPAAWVAWPAGKLRAVLLHEAAHVARRDTLVNLVSRVNCCVFWFQPIAWWLDRRLDATAEQACDDWVVRATGEPRPYAQVLVEMADAVRQHGRVAWHGVGIGHSRMDDRIDRLLRGEGVAPLSRTRKSVVAVACAVVIVLGVACQRRVAALAEDPEVADRLAKQRAATAEYKAATGLTVEQVRDLEARVALNPDDLESTRKLLIFYRESGQKVLGWNRMVAARRPHLLRLIERHPESDLTWWPMKRALDPVGYAQARALWMAQVGKPDVTSKTLGAAAHFFGISEKPIAEELLLRAQALDPDGPQPRVVDNTYYSPWVSRLGELYARAIVGSDDETLFNVVKSIDLDEARGAFAAGVRHKLQLSKDPGLLRAAGSYLVMNASQVSDTTLGFDHVGLGHSYLQRARQLDPDSIPVRQAFAYLQKRDWYTRYRAAVGAPPDDAKVATLSDTERMEFLPQLADEAFFAAESAEYYRKDMPKFEASLERARRLADESLAVAARHSQDARARAAVYRAHVTLGVVAIRRGQRASAVEQMRRAVEAPGSPEIAEYADSLLLQRLVNYLLKAGERETVADFLDRAAAFSASEPGRFTKDARAIRDGRMPAGYQYMLARQ
jgi:beta-lactamase regulating signal transducer with metallopeptidase domain